MRWFTLLVLTSALVVVSSAEAEQHTSICTKAFSARQAVIEKHGKRAPGRNICRYGVKHSDGIIIAATTSQKARYLRQLRLLATSAAAVPPSVPPAGVLTARGTPSSNSMVNPQCESGGNPQVWDPSGTYWGKYQFDQGTWVAHGGSRSSFGNAPEAMQDIIASHVRYDAWPNC